ncbi:MAG: GNAT family N-acetyltransferase [Flavobacteriales bacterium]|nr:GNAT family N-acetyltransferase [Flavobacteriales bacterium]
MLKLRINVFVVEQNCPYPECDDKDQKSIHLFAQDETGEVHAYLRIVSAGISYQEISIGRVASSAALRGTGLGKELMMQGLSFIEEQYGNVPVRISAQLYLRKFYESFGFIVQGETYLEDDIPHIEMTVQL